MPVRTRAHLDRSRDKRDPAINGLSRHRGKCVECSRIGFKSEYQALGAVMADRITIDAEELELLSRYEEEFKETPPIAFLAPKESKILLRASLKSGIPFGEKELDA